MRVQFTLKAATMEALTKRAEAADLLVSRVVEHVLSQWLLKNEPLVFGITASAPTQHAARVGAPAPMLNPRGEPMVPPEAFMTPSGKRRVDRVNFRMPICAECTMDVKEEEIGPGDMHIGCPGRT